MSTTRHSSAISIELTALPAPPSSISDGFAMATCTGAGSAGGTSGEVVEAVSTTGSGLFRAIDASATAPASDSLAIAASVGPGSSWCIEPGCGAPASSCSAEREGVLMSLCGAAPMFWISAGPKAASKPTNPVARMTDRNNGAGTSKVAACSSFQPHRNRIAQPSMRTPLIVRTRYGRAMAQMGRLCAFPGCVACVQRQAAGLPTPARWATMTVNH